VANPDTYPHFYADLQMYDGVEKGLVSSAEL
jgi:hypothetical protein